MIQEIALDLSSRLHWTADHPVLGQFDSVMQIMKANSPQ